ncbi:MAG: HD domain-containing phosphohydrolase [Pseudomonadota bacterium]
MNNPASSDTMTVSRRPRGLARNKRTSSLQTYLSAMLITVVLIVGGLLTLQNYLQNTQTASTATDGLFERIGREMALELNNLFKPIEQLVDIIARQQLAEAANLEDRLKRLPGLVEALQRNSALTAFFVGYDNGDFFMVRSLRNDPAAFALLGAPANTAFMVQSIVTGPGGARQAHYIYLTAKLQTIKMQDRPEYMFDPRQRDWYRRAMAGKQQIKTKPYVFFTTRELGVTFARRSHAGNSVVGADITLSDLSHIIAKQKVTPSADLVLVDAQGSALAYRKPGLLLKSASGENRLDFVTISELGGAQFAELATRLQEQVKGSLFEMDADGRQWLGRIVPIDGMGDPLFLAMAAPKDELLVDAMRIRRISLLTTLLILLLMIPFAWLLAWRLGTPLRLLAQQARAMQRFDFSPSVAPASPVSEMRNLADSMEETKATIHHFMDIASALAAEQNLDNLLERIVSETISIARADVGALYLLDDDRKNLRPQLVKWREQEMQTDLSSLASIDVQQEDNQEHLLCRALCGSKTVISILHAADIPGGWLGGIPAQMEMQEFSVAAIPLRNRQEEAIGLILLAGPVRATEEIGHLISFLEALSGTAAISIENKQLVKAQKDLLESFIQVVAGAIDAKSPYTGGHCQRVPDLTKMLAQAACETQQGPFKDFTLNERQWEAVHIGSWLHDCGKVTTPEYVVDKATKLETIYDRINEIRMRFEVLKRDREIACLRAIADGGNRVALEAALVPALQQMDEEFAFVASCNVGNEFMAPEKLLRLQDIAQRTWMRTLDDRIGISWEELQRKNQAAAPALPTEEMLLADKPEHRIARSDKERIAADNPWNFKLHTPELLYNRGELYNLSVSRGTLTEEERYKINDHIVQTIIMLNRLPFPPHLSNVPEIAGAHHEKMDGSGYPKRLSREQMSPVARMMAIADIFEALTAADRPYKTGKTLSESIHIMSRMKADEHIDPDLFDLFLASGIYLRYAEKYMSPALIDAVDIGPYLGAKPRKKI